MQTALESTPKDQVTESNIHLKNLHVGLTMVSSSLQKVFKKYGVEVIDPLGEKFNPNLHEALFQQVTFPHLSYHPDEFILPSYRRLKTKKLAPL